MTRNFGISFYDIFSHEIFIHLVKNDFLWYSQDVISFLANEVYPQCKPFKYLASEQIKKMENIWNDKKFRSPDIYKPAEKFAKMFDDYFGEGEYEKRFPFERKGTTTAASWDLNTFKVN